MTPQKGLLRTALTILRDRPGHLIRAGRCYVLFQFANVARRLRPLRGVALGENVRVQRNRCLMAEAPQARINIGSHSIIYEDCRIEAYGSGVISIGAESILGGAKILSRQSIVIGERFLSSWNVFIQDFDPHPIDRTLRSAQVQRMVASFRPRFTKMTQLVPELEWDFPTDEIIIGDDVWIGAGATILKGARIGSGCIVATGAVVPRGVYPSHTIVAGNPAVIVKNLDPEKRSSAALHDLCHTDKIVASL